ncbi:MAG TPA: hypothetical protein VGR69_06205 [Candidatus Rubrimentiphilum sp.]|nr:hypothetical protein [Candidatus Rubrimentiphilum sp.]
MNRVALAFAIGSLVVSAAGFAAAQEMPSPPPPYATPTPIPNSYNDPAMSFVAPSDFYQAPIPPHDPMNFDNPTTVAEWFRHPGQRDQQIISITMENQDASLAGFEMNTENSLRDSADNVFFKQHQTTTLSNGMPAVWQEISVGSGFDEIKRFDYVWVDGVRGVTLAITARYGEIDEATARKDLANASAVLYPRNRR